MSRQNEQRYDDIINMPHHQSVKHKHMSMIDRAAQFSPFAALTGYEDRIEETARVTDVRKELTEEEKTSISARLYIVQQRLEEMPKGTVQEVSVTYFVPDAKKAGGRYVCQTGGVKKVDDIDAKIIMADGTCIPIVEVVALEAKDIE